MVAPVKYVGSLWHQFETHGTEYEFEVRLIPNGLPVNHAWRENHDDRSLHVPNGSGSIWFRVTDNASGALAAVGVFAADNSVVRCDTIEVFPEHRRRGIALEMYMCASDIFHAPVVPSDTLSNDAKLFWGTRTQIQRLT